MLKLMVNTTQVHGDSVSKLCAKSRESCFHLTRRVFAHNNVKLHYSCRNFDSHTLQGNVHTYIGEVQIIMLHC